MTQTSTPATTIRRYGGNPVLTNADVPYTDGLVYNGSVIQWNNESVMLVRVDHADLSAKKLKDVTTIALARSSDGIHWKVDPEPCIAWHDEEIVSPTDPRVMLVEGTPYVSIATQTKHGMETRVLKTEDFKTFEPVFNVVPDNRDIVIFPEKIGGLYYRLERPFPTFGHGRKPVFDIWMSRSPDLRYWGDPQVLLDVDHVPFADSRIGPGPAPLRTDRGWLQLFHGVDGDPARGKQGWEEEWTNRYTMGAMLLDLENPRQIVGLTKQPLMVPEAPYEVSGGYRNNIVFPCGMVQQGDTLQIYYGAADTVQCLATASLSGILAQCEAV